MSWQSSRGGFRAIVALDGPTAVSSLLWLGMKMELSSEESRFTDDPRPTRWKSETGTLSFVRAGAVLLASEKPADIAEERK